MMTAREKYRGAVSKSKCNQKVSFKLSSEFLTTSDMKKETPTHMFSCEYWEILKTTYFEEYLQMTTSLG